MNPKTREFLIVRVFANLQNDDCIIICWEGVLVGYFGICEFTPRVPRAGPVPSQISGARGSWDTASPMHGLVPRASGMTNTPGPGTCL